MEFWQALTDATEARARHEQELAALKARQR
jgi:hypothetical protein